MKRVYIIGTADTKGPELLYIKTLVEAAGASSVARRCWAHARPPSRSMSPRPRSPPSIHGARARARNRDRRSTTAARRWKRWARPSRDFISSREDIGGVIGIGGGGGTSIITAGLRRLPVGLPKIMVSTLAAGDVKPFVGASDITMMYSVTDVSGLNRISRVVLGNAAHAIAGMAQHTRSLTAAMKPAHRTDHVRRDHGLRNPRRGAARRALRLPRVPRDRHRRPVDGEAGGQRDAGRCHRRHHHRGLRSSASAAC